ncbi:MAG: SDR family NAD(P)-dependent oxidoreductase, partial [Actinomycetota bacterium]
MSDFDGTVAVVTGAAKGIGKAVANKLVEHGARVALLDVDEPAAARDPVAGAEFIRCDVGRSEDVERAVAAAARINGRIDVLVNSAGIQRYGSVVDTDEATWDEVMTVNLKAMYLTARNAVPHMLAADGGAIVNIASVQGLVVQRGVAAYAASKGGVIA